MRQVAAPKFMWETGFLGAVFNSGASVVDTLFSSVNLTRPATAFVDLMDDKLDEVPIAKALRKGAAKPIYLDSFSRASSENGSSKRTSFLSGWVTLILVNCSAFSAFDDALRESAEPDRDSVLRCVTECLAAKATSTIGKRLGAMSKYAAHCEAKGLTAFPLSEKSLYDYMSVLHSNVKSSASSGRSFLEAIRFSAAILGLHGLEKDKVPQRVSGLAELLSCSTVVQGLRTCQGSSSLWWTELLMVVLHLQTKRLQDSLKHVPCTQRAQGPGLTNAPCCRLWHP